jgi:hypothetical protein
VHLLLCQRISQAPRKEEVDLYVNLPSLLKEELLKKKVIPQWVILNTSSDCFQHHPDILNITYEVIRILVDRGIGISFLTKGLNPHRFIKKGPFQNLAAFKDFRCHSFSPFNCSGVLSSSHNLQMFFHPIAVQPQGNCSPGRCGRTDY